MTHRLCVTQAHLTNVRHMRHTSRLTQIYVIYVWKLHEWDHLVHDLRGFIPESTESYP
eukprot:SAG11_NODE_1276_length_5324_cov_2.528421_2_plen_58_part_00